MRRLLLPLLLLAVSVGCQPGEVTVSDRTVEVSPDPETPPASRSPAPVGNTVCLRFASRVAESARRSPDDPRAFLAALQEEFVGGTGDPFELERGLREGAWNQAYFYAGDGGFRDPLDDAERNADGGNHQPGHFVAVLSVAVGVGEEQARVAIAYAGDYDPGEEDDLRLSERAIELGAGLADGSVAPAEVARDAQDFCERSTPA